MRYIAFLLAFCICSCNHPHPAIVNITQPVIEHSIDTTGQEEERENDAAINDRHNYQDAVFTGIKEYPAIKDTMSFTATLKNNCHIWIRPFAFHHTSINYFKKVLLFGSKKNVYMIEWDYHGGPMAEYPWKQQFVFDDKGKLLKILDEVHLDTETIFKGKQPFLFGMISTAKGNGSHELYRMRKDKLEQVYDGFLGTQPNTYSTGYFNFSNDPNELHHEYVDINNDGHNDLAFYGKLAYEANSKSDTIPVKYIFIYHPKNGHFIEKEDYSKKYEYIYGDTR